MKKALENCPFCDSKAKQTTNFEGQYIIYCTAGDACGARMFGRDLEDLIARWNLRQWRKYGTN